MTHCTPGMLESSSADGWHLTLDEYSEVLEINAARLLICDSQTVQLWGRVKSMDANVQVRSKMCV